jgi:hypothetical protein
VGVTCLGHQLHFQATLRTVRRSSALPGHPRQMATPQ